MTSQIYLSGRLSANPELSRTKKGNLMVKVLLVTQSPREVRPGDVQLESTTLPILFFSGPAEMIKDLQRGAEITVGCRLTGTRFENGDVIKHGVQLIADSIFLGGAK